MNISPRNPSLAFYSIWNIGFRLITGFPDGRYFHLQDGYLRNHQGENDNIFTLALSIGFVLKINPLSHIVKLWNEARHL